MHQILRACALCAPLACAAAAPAAAHVTANPNEAPAGSYFRTALRVSHGCKDAPTVAVRVKLPEGVASVKPQAKPGWRIEIKMRKLDRPIQAGHGHAVHEVVDEVAWRGGPLPNEHFDEFGLLMRLPDAPGAVLWLPTVQECEGGAARRWINVPAANQKWGDLEEPAPFVKLLPPAVR